MKLVFLQVFISVVLTGFSNCTTIKSSNIIYKNDNQNIIKNSSNMSKIIDNKWQPAVFEGLKIGEASRSEALKVLGKPSSSTNSDYNDKPINSGREDVEILDIYESFGFYENLMVVSTNKSGIVVEILSRPKNLQIEQVIKHFGSNYKKTQYDFAECSGDAGSSGIYESKNGEFKYIEYRSKGIAIKIDNSEKQVEEISFVSQPIGNNSSDCPKTHDK